MPDDRRAVADPGQAAGRGARGGAAEGGRLSDPRRSYKILDAMPHSPAIRRATPDDAETVSVLATRTFVETFGHLYPAEDLQAFLANAYAVEKQRVILSHRSEEHTSELQSLMRISYAVFCLKK